MKFVASLFVALTLIATPIFVALAQQEGLDTVGTASGLGNQDLLVTIGRVVQVFLGLLGVIFLLLTIYAGYLWMTSQGDEEKVQKAINIIKSATIGLIICLAAFAIATWIVNALIAATGLGSDTTDDSATPTPFSDALGSGGIEDHYPPRNGTDIARNTKIIVTFKEEVYIPSLIVDYDTGADASDVSDDTAPAVAYLNTDNVTISCVDPTTAEETDLTSTEVTVAFTEDLQTFVFDPPVLGSSVYETTCTVALGPGILEADGANVFTGSSAEGYQWSFTVSTEIDTTPPTIRSIYPTEGATDARNVLVQIVFSEAVDPTTTSGTYDLTEGGFTNIQVQSDEDETGTYSPVAGTFVISSGYTVVEFTSADACGTNSCGETIYCLPGPSATEATEEIQLEIQAADLGDSPPEAATPYTGVVDVAGNSLDGNDDGTAGDDARSDFSVTDEIVLAGPELTDISPNPVEEDVDVDADLTFIWDTIMRSSTLTNSNISLYAYPDHELYYVARNSSYDSSGVEVTATTQTPDHTVTEMSHGTFVESIEDDPSTAADESTSQLYAPLLPDAVQSIYQNCFYPAVGPGASETTSCDGTANNPYCCDGVEADAPFNATTFSCP